MTSCALRSLIFMLLMYMPASSRANRAQRIHQLDLKTDDKSAAASRHGGQSNVFLNASQIHMYRTETPAIDSENTATAFLSLMAFLAPAFIIMLAITICSVRMIWRRVRPERTQEVTAEKPTDDLFLPMKPWHGPHTSAMASLKMIGVVVIFAALMYGCVEWIQFVATGPFARRFVCTDTKHDAPSADLSPMAREALRGFCWEGYRWVGVNRREAELLIMGLEKSLVETTASGQLGDVVELGAALGETTLWVSRFLDLYAKKTGEPRRGHRVYDAFEGPGFPACDSKKDGMKTCNAWWLRSALFRRTMNFFLADRRWLLRLLLRSQSATLPGLIQKGFFADNPPEVYPEKVAFAMFDSDMYISILDSFKQVYPRMSNPGGISFVHDVDRSCCGGPRVAASQYLAAHGGESKGFYTWHGKNLATWAAAGPSVCKVGHCVAPPGDSWQWNDADANAAEAK